jgi:hypothetical protein
LFPGRSYRGSSICSSCACIFVFVSVNNAGSRSTGVTRSNYYASSRSSQIAPSREALRKTSPHAYSPNQQSTIRSARPVCGANQFEKSSYAQAKGKGPDQVGALFSFWLRRLMSGWYRAPFTSDSHRVRGVFSFVQLLSPVESSSLPLRSSRSSHPACTPRRGSLQEIFSGFSGSTYSESAQ